MRKPTVHYGHELSKLCGTHSLAPATGVRRKVTCKRCWALLKKYRPHG